MLKFLLLASCVLFFSCAKESTNIYTQDFAQLIKYINKTHPDPVMAFGSKQKMETAIRNAEKQLQANLTKEEFKFIVDRFFAKMHDGHSHLWENSNKSNKEEIKKLPIKFKIAQDSIFIQSVRKDNYKNLIGCNITHFNKLPIGKVLDKVSLISPTENKFGAKFKLINYLSNNKNIKKIFPVENSSLTIKCADVAKTVEVKYLKEKEADKWITKGTRVLNDNQPFLKHEFVGDIAYLRWDTVMAREAFEMMRNMGGSSLNRSIYYFYYRYMNRSLPKDISKAISQTPALSDSMASILEAMKNRKSKYLVIDLRKNGGGYTPIVLPVLYMIYGDKYYTTKYPYLFKTKISPLYLQKNSSTLEEFNKKNKTNFKIGEFRIQQDEDLSPIEKRKKEFAEARAVKHPCSYLKHIEKLDGNAIYTPQLVFLVSPNTFSAAYHFMWFGWHLGAKIVGVTPSQAGNCFMEVTEFELPNTKLKGYVSSSAQIFFSKDKKMGKEFLPNFSMSFADYKKYQFSPDAEMLYALDLIKAGKI